MELKTETIPLPGRMSFREFSELLAGYLSRIRVQKVEVTGTQIVLTHEVKPGEVLPNPFLDPLLQPADMLTRGGPGVSVGQQPSLITAAVSCLMSADKATVLPIGWLLPSKPKPPARYLGYPVFPDQTLEPGQVILLAGVDEGGGYQSTTTHFVATFRPSQERP